MLNAAYTVKHTLGLRQDYIADKYTCLDGWLAYNIAKGIGRTEMPFIIRSGPYRLTLPTTSDSILVGNGDLLSDFIDATIIHTHSIIPLKTS